MYLANGTEEEAGTKFDAFPRMLTARKMTPPFLGVPGGSAISDLSFLHGAVLFFVLAIASSCRTAKS